MDGGVSFAGVTGASPSAIPQAAIRGLLGSGDAVSRSALMGQVPVPTENAFGALDEQDPEEEEEDAEPSSATGLAADQPSEGPEATVTDEGGEAEFVFLCWPS